MPGPPFEGIFSPAATSISVGCQIGQLGAKKVAARLSPPDPISAKSSGRENVALRHVGHTAARLAEASSRIAARGQPPLLDACDAVGRQRT